MNRTKKTYLIKSKFMPYNLVYGAWIEYSSWCWIDRTGATVIVPKEHYEICGEWPNN